MISVARYDEQGSADQIVAEDISEHVGRDGELLWVDVVDATQADFACLQDEFGLHPLAIEDAVKHGQRPKLERYPDHAFLVAYSASLAEVDVFIGDGWIMTVRGRNEDGDAWDPSAARVRFERARGGTATVGALLHAILDELVDGYFSRTDAVEDELEALEERIFESDGAGEQSIQADLYAVRRDLVAFRRRIVPLRDVLAALLRREVTWVDDTATTYLQDVFDHLMRVIDVVDSQRELLGNAVDAQLALSSNRMNQVMKRMTSWGAILLGATLVAGIYGMNFKNMPELGWELGYPFALGIMGTITVFGYVVFSKKEWL